MPIAVSWTTTRGGPTRRRLPAQHAGDGDADDHTRSKTSFFDETDAEMRAWARA